MLFELNILFRAGERFKLSNNGGSVCREYISLQLSFKNWDSGMVVTAVYLYMVVKRRILIVFKHWIKYEGKLKDLIHRQ